MPAFDTTPDSINEPQNHSYSMLVPLSINEPVAPVTSLPVNIVLPVISGSAVENQTLTTSNGTWTGYPAPTFTYQWQRAGSSTPPTLTYRYGPAALSNTFNNTYLAVPIGAADPTRVVVVVMQGRHGGSGTTTAHITANAGAINFIPAGVMQDSGASFITLQSASIPAGTTADIFVEMTNGSFINDLQIAVYTMVNSTTVASSTGVTPWNVVNPGPMVVTATVPTGGVGIAGFATDRPLSPTWSNATQDFHQSDVSTEDIFAVHTSTAGSQTPTSSAVTTNYAGVMATWGPGSGGDAGNNTMRLDGGTSVVNSTASSTVALTTTGGSGIIVVGVISSGSSASVSSVTAPGLTFTPVSASPRQQTGGTGDWSFMYTAPYSTNFSGNITITMSAATYHVNMVMGISGAKTVSPVDAAASSGTAAPSLTTTNAHDAVVAIFETGGSAASPGTGWTASPGSDATTYGFMEYRFTTATGTYTANLTGFAIPFGIIVAIKEGP